MPSQTLARDPQQLSPLSGFEQPRTRHASPLRREGPARRLRPLVQDDLDAAVVRLLLRARPRRAVAAQEDPLLADPLLLEVYKNGARALGRKLVVVLPAAARDR